MAGAAAVTSVAMPTQTYTRVITARYLSAGIVACGGLGCQSFFACAMVSKLAENPNIHKIPDERTKVSPITLLTPYQVILLG
jgi:hypothetical protein